MKKPLFTGVCTALVTPFLDGKINYPMMEMLLRRQLEAGIKAVVITGTTGEAPTVTDEEKLELLRRCKAYAGDEMLIIAGTGSNDTVHTLRLSQAAEKCGADALLVVSPYYNKATPEGLYAHFSAVAQAVRIPVIVYNVPSRTGVDIPVEVYKRLSRIPNIAGIKEASTDITKFTRIRGQCDLPVWAGNDEMTAPVLALGGAGVISVLSNVVPEEAKLLAEAALDGDYDTAADLQIRLQSLTEALFCEVSPIPVKEAMRIMGYDCGECRLPLTPLRPENRAMLKKLLS